MTPIMTFRQLRWLTTLYRHRAFVTVAGMPPWRRTRRGMLLAVFLLMAGRAGATATLRGFGELNRATVHLSDLFDNLGPTPDRVLGPAPSPGDRIVVEAPQLAAIARDYGVDWRPASGAERIILQRAGEHLAAAVVMPPLRAALADLGAPADADITLPGFDPPLLPAGATPHAAVSETSFDPATGHFTAMLGVSASGMQTIDMHIAGQVSAMTDAAVLTHHLRRGSVLRAEDLRGARVRVALLHGNNAISVAAALGQSLRHDLPPGQPLTSADISRPVLVARGGAVTMRLEADGISLSAQGVALEDGGLGDTVRIQNPSSKAIVRAIITASGEARVAPDRLPVEVAQQ
jgi:flagella basal body P-ring formation protein FlgA